MILTPKKFSLKISILLTICYAVLISFISSHHEIWRDEMRALSIVREAESFLDIFNNLKNEGHPFIWHAFLYVVNSVFPHPVILKGLSLLAASAAVFFLFWKAPFSWPQKFLFLAGHYLCFEYAVFGRHYGLTLFFLFLTAHFYGARRQKILPLIVSLTLLGNTNTHGLILVMVLWGSLFLEGFFKSKDFQPSEVKSFKLGLGLGLVGILAAIFQVIPDQQSIVKIYYLTPDYLEFVLKKVLLFPAESFWFAFNLQEQSWMLNLGLWIFYLSLFPRKPFLGIFFFAGVLGLALFFFLIYPGSTRQQGLVYFLFAAVLWMDKGSGEPLLSVNPGDRIWRPVLALREGFFWVMLIMGVLMGYQSLKMDFEKPFSSSKAFGDFLNSRSEWREAILIPEPDYNIESVVYYVPNMVYLPREHRFGKFVHYTTENDQTLFLSTYLEAGKKLSREMKKPVLFLLGFPLREGGYVKENFGYDRVFQYSPEDRARFLAETEKIAGFWGSVVGEDYDVYRLKTDHDQA